MMIDKELIKQSIRRVLSDRSFMTLAIALLLLGVLVAISVAISIHPSDVTVYSRYTAFGEAHFYKSHWQYLLGFVAFSLLVAIAHAALMVKLYVIERRQTALLIGWLGIVILLLTFVYASAVIGLGYAA
jgi:hypothetical protein